MTHDNGETLQIIIKLLMNCEYDVGYKILYSIEHDVPQMRQRIYIVGVRKDTKLKIRNIC